MQMISWESINWTCQDVEIARVIGCSREYVRQVRKALGRKESPAHKQQPETKCGEIRAKLKAYLEANGAQRLSSMTLSEISEAIGVEDVRPYYYLLSKLGIAYKRASSGGRQSLPWAELDWRLGNKTLFSIWWSATGRPKHYVSISSRRSFLSKGRATLSGGEEFADAVAKESMKAAYWAKARGLGDGLKAKTLEVQRVLEDTPRNPDCGAVLEISAPGTAGSDHEGGCSL